MLFLLIFYYNYYYYYFYYIAISSNLSILKQILEYKVEGYELGNDCKRYTQVVGDTIRLNLEDYVWLTELNLTT